MSRRVLCAAAFLLIGCQRTPPTSAPPEVKLEAAEKPEAMYKNRPVSAWAKQLRDKDGGTQIEAVRALAAVGPEAKSAVPELVELLTTAEPNVQDAVVHALEQIEPAPAARLGVYEGALRGQHAGRLKILRVLRGYGRDAAPAVPTLVALLDDKDAAVRVAVMDVLEAVGPGAAAAKSKLAEIHVSCSKPDTRYTLDDLEKSCAALKAIDPKYTPPVDPEKAAEELTAYYISLYVQGNVFLDRKSVRRGWRDDVKDLLSLNSTDPALPPGKPAEGVSEKSAARLVKAQKEWEAVKTKLTHLLDLVDALDGTADPDRARGVLVLPEPAPGIDSASLAGVRWTALRRDYPRQSDDYKEWELRNFPAWPHRDLEERLKRSFEAGTRHVRKLMRVQDTPDGWKELATALNEPTFREWGRLLHLLARLQGSSMPDPVVELANFLSDLDTKTLRPRPACVRTRHSAGVHRRPGSRDTRRTTDRNTHARERAAGDAEVRRGLERDARQEDGLPPHARRGWQVGVPRR